MSTENFEEKRDEKQENASKSHGINSLSEQQMQKIKDSFRGMKFTPDNSTILEGEAWERLSHAIRQRRVIPR